MWQEWIGRPKSVCKSVDHFSEKEAVKPFLLFSFIVNLTTFYFVFFYYNFFKGAYLVDIFRISGHTPCIFTCCLVFMVIAWSLKGGSQSFWWENRYGCWVGKKFFRLRKELGHERITMAANNLYKEVQQFLSFCLI